jgi:hypothetical protein
MKLKHFLLTEGRTQKISEEDFYKKVKVECSDILKSYNNRNFYYRGIKGFKEKFGFVKPSSFERESENTDNYYTLLMDNLPSWKNYPKRSKSIVFTNDIDTAVSYGNSYILFPKNGVKIAEASAEDIWYSFPKLKRFEINILTTFNERLNHQISREKLKKPKTFQELKNLLSNINDPLHFNNEESWWDNIIPLFDPKDNGFTLLSPKKPVGDKIREFWSDSDFYVTLYWKHEEIFDNLYKKNPVIKKRPKSILDVIEER